MPPSSPYPDYTEGQDCAREAVQRFLTPGHRSLLDVVSAGEKLLMQQHDARVQKIADEVSRRRYHRQFLYSMSPAAKRAYERAYERADRQELEAAESAVFKLTDQLRRNYFPDDFLDENQKQYAGDARAAERRIR